MAANGVLLVTSGRLLSGRQDIPVFVKPDSNGLKYSPRSDAVGVSEMVERTNPRVEVRSEPASSRERERGIGRETE